MSRAVRTKTGADFRQFCFRLSFSGHWVDGDFAHEENSECFRTLFLPLYVKRRLNATATLLLRKGDPTIASRATATELNGPNPLWQLRRVLTSKVINYKSASHLTCLSQKFSSFPREDWVGFQRNHKNPGDAMQIHIVSLYRVLQNNSLKLLTVALTEGVYLYTWLKGSAREIPTGPWRWGRARQCHKSEPS